MAGTPLVYETKVDAVDYNKQVGNSGFRIHTWFDHQRNTMVVDILTSKEAAHPAKTGNN